MKILHVITSLDNRFGGPPIALINLVKSQLNIPQIKKIFILTTFIDDKEKRREFESVYDLKDKRFKLIILKARTFYRLFFNFPKIIHYISKSDIIHIHGLYRFPVIISAVLARFLGKPFIIRTHGSLDPYLKHRSKFGLIGIILKNISELIVERANLNSASYLHFTSEEEYRLSRNYHSNKRIIIVSNGVEYPKKNIKPYDFNLKFGLTEKNKKLLFLGRIHQKKGLDILLSGFEKAFKKDNNLVLIIAGPDNENILEKLLYQYKRKNLPIFSLGQVNHKQIGDYFSAADLFVLTSYTENFGIAVVESISYGLPVLISKYINIYREIKNLKCGLTCDLDADSIATAMLKGVYDLDLRNHVKKFGSKEILDKYSWLSISKTLYFHYLNAIKGN